MPITNAIPPKQSGRWMLIISCGTNYAGNKGRENPLNFPVPVA
nr:MAG TPA: hypothetical protein [Caudoviricetes sp.]